jgi:integrase
MSVYKRNPEGQIVKDDEKGTWYYDFTIEGRRYKKALVGIRTRRKAEDIEEAKRFEVYSGNAANKSGRTLFKQFVTDTYLPYKKMRLRPRSYYQYQILCEQACDFFRNKTLREIEDNPELIENFIRHRCNSPTKNGTKRGRSTVNVERDMLSNIFSVAVKRRYIKSNPCKSVDRLPKATVRRTAVFQPEDEVKLLNALTGTREKYRPVVILGLHTGMRLNEILSLEWAWIDIEKAEISLPKDLTKNGEPGTIYLNGNALNALAQLRDQNKSRKKVFPTGNRSGFSLCRVSHVISETCDDIGLPNATMHATRRTFNTRLIEKTKDVMATKELMRHRDLKMTDWYTHLNRNVLREAVKKLESEELRTVSVPEEPQ